MSFTSWAVTLNGVTLTSGCEHATIDESCGNADNILIDGLTNPPEGLGLPALRTEDIVFAQRDGTKHYNDWYEPRTIMLSAMIGPDENCSECSTVRQQLSELISAWRRSCCDIELVIHTPCDGQFIEGVPYLGPQTIRYNLVANPSFEESLTGWSVPADSFCRSYDRCYDMTGGTTWCYSNAIDGAFTSSRGTDGGWVGDGYYRLTCTVVPTNPGVGFTYGTTAAASPDVAAGSDYTASAYLRSSGAHDVVAQILWYDTIGTLLGVTPGTVVHVPGTNTWTRVTVTGSAPASVDYAHVQFVTTDVVGWVAPTGTLDIDGALFETGTETLTYFDGDTPATVGPPVVGEQVINNIWVGAENNSISVQSTQTYVENNDRSLFGPYGIVGRPRVASYTWVNRAEQIADIVLRFDGTDQRIYVLDECGTPGYQTCNTLVPGLETNCRSYDLCYTSDGGRCYNQSSAGSVLPTTVALGGTERVNPLIVLYPQLSYPTVENLDTGEFVTFNGVVDTEPIMIDTENGTATGVNSGGSYTHLLGGSIFLSITPGETQFRMFSRSSTDPGSASICYRDTVVMG